ncbi:hypothetical protein HMPREF0291_11103 [Corynebacterium genitalium ATCC 33030]|uniref:Polyhydroxybutyrate depolymerase n=2 Tax=Corynebacterium genitalium TaxID=38288 RepID=D7WC94_9CORY|nr:hypothetical protein HMPREF0291_11103 [Corynebacterium genitalium ATCC 33030]
MAAALSVAAGVPAAGAQSSSDIPNLSSQTNLNQLTQMSSDLLDFLPKAGAGAGSQTIKRTVQVGGMQRHYTVVVPQGYNPGQAYPVIIGFGGWQHNADQARGYEKLESAAGSRAIIVYAQGVNNAWGGAPYANTSVNTDVTYTRAVVNDLARTHNVDRSRVYAAGLSNGGGMALALACHAPDLVDGVAGVSGAYYNPTVTNCASGRVKTLIMHADNDDIVSYNGGNRHGGQYRDVRSVFWDFGGKNGCNMNSVNNRRVGNTTVFDPQGCKAKTQVQKVSGGGHTWFTNPSATRETVNFFLG